MSAQKNEPEPTRDERNRELDSPNDRFGERLRTNVSAEGVQAKIIESETRLLERTFEELLTSGVVPHASTIVVGARRRYLAGWGKSSAYAALLNADLSATLSNVFLIDGHALSPLTVLTDVRSSDVLVLVTLRRYRDEAIALGRLFHEAGGQLVLITDSADSPLADLADAVIVVHTDSASYADSPTGVAAVCHLLSTLATASAKGARRRLAARDDLIVALGLHHPDGHQATSRKARK